MPTMEEHARSDDGTQSGRAAAALNRAGRDGTEDQRSFGRIPTITYTESLDDGRTMSVNPELEVMLGCTQDEWLSDPLRWVSMIHPDDRDRVLEACWEANRTGEPYRAEYRMVTPDGRILWFNDEAELVLGASGQPLCWEGRLIDITAEKMRSERLHRRPTA